MPAANEKAQFGSWLTEFNWSWSARLTLRSTPNQFAICPTWSKASRQSTAIARAIARPRSGLLK